MDSTPNRVLFLFFLFTPFLCLATSADVPFLDLANIHNSFSTAFVFPGTNSSAALCTKTICHPPPGSSPPKSFNSTDPPRHGHANSTHNHYNNYNPDSYLQTWTKVHVNPGSIVHLEFGIPYITSLQYPPFRPDVYILGLCLPLSEEFLPRPTYIFPLPQSLKNRIPPTANLSEYKALKFHLGDTSAVEYSRPEVSYNAGLGGGMFSVLLNDLFQVECEEDIYIVVEGTERRSGEYFIEVGVENGVDLGTSSRGGSTGSSFEETRRWALGEGGGVGEYCGKKEWGYEQPRPKKRRQIF